MLTTDLAGLANITRERFNLKSLNKRQSNRLHCSEAILPNVALSPGDRKIKLLPLQPMERVDAQINTQP